MDLYIGNKNYSSWSLRPWILLETLGIPFTEKLEVFGSDDNYEQFRTFSPNGRVPCLVDGDNVVWDSLAIVEYLAESHAGVWPEARSARTFARCATAEMHAGFSNLRNTCPMNCAITVAMHAIAPGLQRELGRLDELFSEGLTRFGGPFLAGATFTAVDAFYCPVALRVKGYQLPLGQAALDYCERLASLPGMQAWCAAGIREPWVEQAHEEEAAAAGKITRDLREA